MVGRLRLPTLEIVEGLGADAPYLIQYGEVRQRLPLFRIESDDVQISRSASFHMPRNRYPEATSSIAEGVIRISFKLFEKVVKSFGYLSFRALATLRNICITRSLGFIWSARVSISIAGSNWFDSK